MQYRPVFLDITQVADFRCKNADASRTQVVYHLIWIFFGSFLVRDNCAKFRLCIICGMHSASFPHPHSLAAPKRPISRELQKLQALLHTNFLNVIAFPWTDREKLATFSKFSIKKLFRNQTLISSVIYTIQRKIYDHNFYNINVVENNHIVTIKYSLKIKLFHYLD